MSMPDLNHRDANVRVEFHDATAILTMQRAAKRNALSLEMMRELDSALRDVGARDDVRAVILVGEGPAFSAGHDLRELQARDESAYGEIFDACVALMATMRAIPQPIVAEVDAMATAAGCQLVAAADLAVASTRARFATPGVRIGLFCSTPMVALSRAIGQKRAMEMLLTGEAIDAPTALQWGLVNRVVEPEVLRETTLALAATIATAARRVVTIGKNAFYVQSELDTDDAYAYTRDVMVFNAQEPDAQEGIAAFVGKRKPEWRP